jgi:hypothetical protein
MNYGFILEIFLRVIVVGFYGLIYWGGYLGCYSSNTGEWLKAVIET